MCQLHRFINANHSDHVCKLHKTIRGFKLASRAYYHELCNCLIKIGFENSHSNHSLFIYLKNSVIMYLFIYVDDLILIGVIP